MKVLHISTSDRQGGAAIAAYRLNEALQNERSRFKKCWYIIK